MVKLDWKVIKYNDGSNVKFEMFQSPKEYDKRIVMLLCSGRNVEVITHRENITHTNVEETLKEIK